MCSWRYIIWNKTQKEINDTVYHKLLKVPMVENEYQYGKNDILALLIILKQMLNKEDFKNMTVELDNVIGTLNFNLHTIKIKDVLNRMGMPTNWKDLATIEKGVDVEDESKE